MPITPDPPFPKSSGDNIRSKDWNDAVQEVQRLDTAKLDRHDAGPLVIGPPTAGPEANRNITVQGGPNAFMNLRAQDTGVELVVGADATGIISTVSNHNLQLRAGGNDTKIQINADGNVGIGTTNPAAKLDVNGGVVVRGQLQIPNSDGGFAAFTTDKPTNTAGIGAGLVNTQDVSLRMASRGLFVLGGFPAYQFAIGHTNLNLLGGGGLGGITSSFFRVFSINDSGQAFFSGGKGGFITEMFVNAVGDPVEQGDVVVLSDVPATHFYGTGNAIPLMEIDLGKVAYDTRVCGIVDTFVSQNDLPSVEPDPTNAEASAYHPLGHLGGKDPEQPREQVKESQMGRMVTLGAYSFCKVDADIAPIETGDLLTTSPTPGHAQKVTDRAKAVGAIIGKALAPLASGKGKIPVLVTLQ